MVAAGLIFGRPSNFHKIRNTSKTLAICCYFEGVVGTVLAAMATEGRRDGVSQPASSQPESQRRSRQEVGNKKTCVLLGKVICCSAIEKNCDPWHVKND